MFKRIPFLILLLSLITGKAFAYELVLGAGYAGSSHAGTHSSSPTLQIDAFAPILFDGLSLGIGISVLQVNLGKSTDLASHFNLENQVAERNISIVPVPTYLSAKYEYFFNNNFSAFIIGKGGIAIAEKLYYRDASSTTARVFAHEDNADRLEVWGNSMYGGSVGVSINKNYMISASFDTIRVRNVNYTTTRYIENGVLVGSTADRFLNYTHVETVSVKLSYAFR
ncbi:MAG: hypothetical protein LBQ34_00585 [Alphaproteobacteria bacterium]|jgi:hypothetical protein|nr:hypothetical protein [Alphaproteobacteria bacterium]